MAAARDPEERESGFSGARSQPHRAAEASCNRSGGYLFRTVWVIAAPRERVFEALWDAQRWPEWWPGLERAEETAPGDERGIGRKGRYSFRSAFGYSVAFDAVATAVERPRLLAADVSAGLEGHGRWSLSELGEDATEVEFIWEVKPARGWVNTIGRAIRPVLVLAHDRVMDAGASGLARHLEAELLAAENR